ncbi:NADPH-dependent F420 reductase [Paraburkholderia sp. SOS3]|uniref:NADPH-dependent F420 reductase n=1 Tax=Paraburkholderia sp. SOS3 TaxID=1926494 RepID=UPI000947320D|nr:NAD(P)-binding domain-containing protein [Paraburkholderia sp. SOS3]APR39172.1 NADP oxidoreductase coenzyme [Paraburkholderia sp. SOS3]
MSYAIIGFGKIGHALARAFARKGIEVAVATTRDPASFAADAAAIGPTIIPTTVAEAVKADVIFLAVRFESHPEVAKALPDWSGKTVVDAMNTQAPLEDLGGLPSSAFVARTFTGASVVKGFNHLVAAVLDQDPAVHGGRRVVFLASDDDGGAAGKIGALAQQLGFAPIQLGGLSEGGLLVHGRGKTWGHLIFKDLIAFGR